MTDSQTLLAEYARSGSESAFRELVTRYLGLVYSAALRLVEGDTHLAEDVAQTVFMDLARKARGLSGAVMLGGWLHQRTFNVAAPMMRAARRRQAREREAVQMNAMPDDPAANLEQIAPMLDEALTKLGKDDRTAIILRFFERRDFRSIGTALGSNEDAARMRVTRALDKLHLLLKHRGVTLSAAALGAALSTEAATAAPVGLATSIAGAALAGSAAGGGIMATLLKIGIMTKLKAGIIGAVVIAGVATTLVVQQQARARLRAQDDSLRQQSDQAEQIAADNERLSNRLARANGAKDQSADLSKLRAEAASLRQQTNDLATLREANRRLQQRPEAKPKTPLQMTEERMAKMTFGHRWVAAFRDYAEKHGDQFPTSFEQAGSFIPAGYKPETNLSTDQFEIVYQGSAALGTKVSEVVVLREKEPWQDSNGKWCKVYGLADGSSQVVAMPSRWTVGGKQISYDSFEAFEKDHHPTAREMSVTAFKAAIVGAVVIASVAAPLAVQHLAQAKWRERNELLGQQTGRLAELSAENKRLSNLVAQAESSALSSEQFRELLRLRGELGQLRQTVSEVAKLRVTNQQLLSRRTNPEEPSRALAPPDPQTVRAFWPKAQLALAGYADPAAALESALWAMSRGDATALAASVTPEARSKLTREEWLQHGPPEEELAAATRNIENSLSPSSGFYIVGQELMAQDQIALDVYFEGEGKTRKVALKRVGGEWKFDNMGNGAWP